MNRNTIDKVHICITYNKQTNTKNKTIKKIKTERKETENMNHTQKKSDDKPKQHNTCPIYLNNKGPCNKRNTDQSCPACANKAASNCQIEHQQRKEPKKDYSNGDCINYDTESGRHLLNEVLSVFQSRRTADKPRQRDASVNTESRAGVTRLSVKSLFAHSIEGTPRSAEGFKSKCIILHATQPQRVNSSHYAILYRKSSSIPQMKLEELKYTLKEKTRSKDVIEEVNRIFATVNKNTYPNGGNRPLVRNGPSVLPVVKNKDYRNETEAKSFKESRGDACMSSGDKHALCEKHAMGDTHVAGDKNVIEEGIEDKCRKHCICCSRYTYGCQEVCECFRRKNFGQRSCRDKQADIH